MPNEPKPVDGPIRKELTQCQHCGKSRLREGVILSKCAGCKIALYCSKECQKTAWPLHKQTCRLNQRILIQNAGVDPVKPLRAFTSQHRPSIAHYGLCAFDLAKYPNRYLDEVLVITVKARPAVNRPELSYIALDAGLCPPTVFGDGQAVEIRQQMQDRNAESIRQGFLGSIWVVLYDKTSVAVNLAPVAFKRDVLEDAGMRDPRWKEKLLYHLNNGIIM